MNSHDKESTVALVLDLVFITLLLIIVPALFYYGRMWMRYWEIC